MSGKKKSRIAVIYILEESQHFYEINNLWDFKNIEVPVQ
jgi:hypothetical protein